MDLLIITADDLRNHVDMVTVIDAVERAYVQLSRGQADVPLRVPLNTPKGVTLFMPGYLKTDDAMAIKIVSVYGENPSKGLPTVTALVVGIDTNTGEPKAIIEGTFLTALRTGAASGVATRALARPDSSVMAIIGSGGQAPTQIEAVCAVRPIRQVRICDLRLDLAEKLAERMSERMKDVEFVVFGSSDEAVSGADVIVTVTTSRRPVFSAEAVSPGAHINGIGAYTPEMQEIPQDIVARARVVIDSKTGALAEAGDLIIPLRDGILDESRIVEIGEVLSGSAPGRESDQEITFFKSVGNAVQDVAVANLVVESAVREGWGQKVSI